MEFVDMNDIKIISKNELSVRDIKTVIRVINDASGKELVTISKDKPLAKKYTLDDGYTVYCFSFEEAIDGDEADSIVGGLYNTLTFDFVAEINSEVVDYDDDIEESIEESDPIKHARWVQEQVDEGWSYGLEFDESNKKNPYIRPYHQLTKTQKKMIDKSKSKLGHYGLYFPYISGNNQDDSGSTTGGDGGE